MFKKVVSHLSLSPSAASQLTFYARRLRQEKVTRTFSAIGAVLVIALQFATIGAPPTPVNAASNNDIIFGGIVSQNDLLNRYDGNGTLQALFNRFGISRNDLQATHLTMINSRDHSLKSLGRIQHLASDQSINVGSTTYWLRGLYTWDTGANVYNGSSYQVLQGTRSSDGGYFAVMLACGNIVVKSLPAPPPPPKPTPPPTPKPTPTAAKLSLACVSLKGSLTSGQLPLKIDFTGAGEAQNQTIAGYVFTYGDGSYETKTTAAASHTYTQAGTYSAKLQIKGSGGATTAFTAPCTYEVQVASPPAAFTKHKTALNVTKNANATAGPAGAGDVIRYTLTTSNTGGTAESYVVVEHLEDVLEYADVTDMGGAQLSQQVLTWPATVIKPGQSLIKTFAVTVKNPIPDTPQSTSDKFSYDLQMDNVYGDQVSIRLQAPPAKQIEAAATNLPQTGSGTAVTITLIIAGLALFFYFRNRQLIAEVKLLRNDYHGGGL